MALFLLSLVVLPLLSLSTSATPTTTHHHHHHHRIHERHHSNGVKSLHFTLYLHETFNKTAYFIVKGVTGPSNITKTSNPFGSLFAFHDPLTATPDPSSAFLGTTEGSAVTSSFDGKRTTCISTIALDLRGYKGELLNVGTAGYVSHTELPMVGGTGDFRYVQGFIRTSPVDLSGRTTCYKIDFNLYWPPYAALFNSL